MQLTDAFKYLSSLFEDETPVAGYMFIPKEDGDAHTGTLIPLYTLLSDKWEFVPFVGFQEASKNTDMDSFNKKLQDYSIDNLKDFYKLPVPANKKEIMPEVIGIIYNLTHPDMRWDELDPFERCMYVNQLNKSIDMSREENRITAQLGAAMPSSRIKAHVNTRSDSVCSRLIQESIPGLIRNLTGSPLFVNGKFNLWQWS